MSKGNSLRRLGTAVFCFVLLYSTSFSQVKPPEKIDITTKLKQEFYDKAGNVLTGKGVVVGDVDSGIDIFQPMFFFADGGEFNWIDVDGDGVFTPGTDAVDLNGNGKADEGEILRYIEMNTKGTYGFIKNDATSFNPDLDFLYLDKNNNSKRDFGEKDGFTENDATYGEQLYIAMDANKNNILDAGEKITALKTSKVRAVMEKSGTVRRRGIDLIKTEPDTIGHGTGVSGIVLGGHYGVQRLHGFAPDAEIVMANIKYEYTPRFVLTFPALLNFLKGENINILLFEDGEWGWEFMDGSTEEEQISDQFARDGIPVIGGAGNLASGNMHIKDTLKKGVEQTYEIKCPADGEGKKNDGVYTSFLWKGGDKNISFTILTPENIKSPELKSGSGYIKVGKYNVFYSRELSSRGTVMFKFGFSEKDSNAINGNWKFIAKPDNNVIIDGFVVDVTQSWNGNSHWTSRITDEATVTFPSTSDSIMAIGAYTVNYGFFPGDKIGNICNYSGRGYTMQGSYGVEVSAPGHTTFTASKNFGYMIFSGTSSAAPHVVGTVALMMQYDPTLTHAKVRQILRNTAIKDEFTGSVPNINWGYGKLNPEGALNYIGGK